MPALLTNMARRRWAFGNPQLGGTLTASQENDAASKREIAINTQAEASWKARRAMELGANDQTEGSNAAHIALAKALGHDPANAPSMDKLMARFFELPPQVQAGIYAKGGAQFINPTSGAKLLQNVQGDREKDLDARTNEVGSHLATGKMNYDLDASGKPQFYSLQDDETDPTGMRKKKVPANALQLMLIDRGIKKGIIPNPFNPDKNDGAIQQPAKMSTEEFQGVLDARANADANTNLLGYKNPSPAFSHNDINTGAYQPAPILPAPAPMDSALRARAAVGNFMQQAPESTLLGDVGNALAQTGTDAFSKLGQGANWLSRFFTGNAAVPQPEDAFETNITKRPLTAMDAAMQAARQKEAEPVWDDTWNY